MLVALVFFQLNNKKDKHSDLSFLVDIYFLLLDDLPDLQEVKEELEPRAPPVFQVEVGVSHQERHANTEAHSSQFPDTHWLTQLAHIATGPQSPLLQKTPHSRYFLLYNHHDINVNV